MSKYYCLDCGGKVTKKSNYCKKCFLFNHNPFKGKKNMNAWKGGWKNKLPYCIDCNKKLSRKDANRCISCSLKYRFKKYGHHSKGIILSEEHRKKISERNKGKNNGNYKHGKTNNNKCTECGKTITYYGNKCNICKFKGENNPNWIDGRSYFPYPQEFNSKLKEKIRKRDNYQCQKCDITEEEHLIVFGEILSIHHIDYSKENCLEENLITLCRNCNVRANHNRKYWHEYFKNKVREYHGT